MTTGLVLSGGGARAAYQVGVLKGLAEILPREVHNPFPIICGTSAGAINALAIAGRPGPFRLRTRKLEAIWRNMEPDRIYRTDSLGVTYNFLRVMMSFFHRGYSPGRPAALLDNTPLRDLLDCHVRFRHIDEAIASGELDAVCITAMSYHTGRSVAFFQGGGRHPEWTRARRVGRRTGLTIDHLMASSAIPTLFPSTRIGDRYYGDGALRQLKPLSPALHLGANRIFVIGVSNNPMQPTLINGIKNSGKPGHSPSIAQVISHMFNSVFIDTIESDLETLRTINRLTRAMSDEERDRLSLQDLKPIDYVSIMPSTPIDEIAGRHIRSLPRSIKLFLSLTGATRSTGGASAASYLLFEKEFCRELMDLGYRDIMEQESEVRRFFGLGKIQQAIQT